MLIVHHVYIVYTIIYTIYHSNVVPLRAVTSYHFLSLPIISYPKTYRIVGNTGTAQRARLSPGRWEMEVGGTSSSKLQGMWKANSSRSKEIPSCPYSRSHLQRERDGATSGGVGWLWVARNIWGLDRKPTGLQPLAVCEGFCFWLGLQVYWVPRTWLTPAIWIDDWCFIKILFNYVNCSSHLAGATLQNLERDGIKSQKLMIPEAHFVLLRLPSIPGASFNIEASWARRLGVQSWDQIDGLQGDLMFLLKSDCDISRCGNPRSQQTSAQFQGFPRNVYISRKTSIWQTWSQELL